MIFCGIIYVLRQLLILVNELNWLNQLLKGSKTKLSVKSPNLLKYLDTFLREQSGSLIFSQSSMKSIMESLDGRLAENREISRYLIGLSVFLGLLGTFWGLLETINSVAITVKSLDFSENTQKLFQSFKTRTRRTIKWYGYCF